MIAQLPNIACLAGRGSNQRRMLIGRSRPGLQLRKYVEPEIDFGGGKAEQLRAEVEIELKQLLELERKLMVIPFGELGEATVCDTECPNFLGR